MNPNLQAVLNQPDMRLLVEVTEKTYDSLEDDLAAVSPGRGLHTDERMMIGAAVTHALLHVVSILEAGKRGERTCGCDPKVRSTSPLGVCLACGGGLVAGPAPGPHQALTEILDTAEAAGALMIPISIVKEGLKQ